MSQDVIATLVVAVAGTITTWFVWATVSIFKHAQEIALLKQEVKLLGEIKLVLNDIRDKL